MMDLNEIAKKSNTEIETISSWIKEGLITPEVTATDSTPFFSEKSLSSIEKIKTLFSFGYTKDAIKKIIKKVGLPEEDKESEKKKVDKNNYLTVGTLAEKVDVSIRTIKHWEEKGIIEPDLRSQGGFRLYKDHYIYFCSLIKDLQLFGYSLEQIKTISDFFRDFIGIREDITCFTTEELNEKLLLMEKEIQSLFERIDQLKKGVKRWDDLLKKQKKQIQFLKEKNKKKEV